jgi:hypothetical protein
MAALASTVDMEVAASASTGAAPLPVISNSTASKIREELITKKYRSGGLIDETTLDSKRVQLAAFDAARVTVRSRVCKWSRQLTDIGKTGKETLEAKRQKRQLRIHRLCSIYFRA